MEVYNMMKNTIKQNLIQTLAQYGEYLNRVNR